MFAKQRTAATLGITDDIVGALKTVYDPEIPADIYELGLIYKIDIEDDGTVFAVEDDMVVFGASRELLDSVASDLDRRLEQTQAAAWRVVGQARAHRAGRFPLQRPSV